jgi:hypothetical protein
MRSTAIGLALGAGLVMAFWGLFPEHHQVFAERPVSVPFQEGGGLITLTNPAGEDRQQLTVIDQQRMVISVYHLNLTTGEIELKAVRKIEWDLQMVEFNGVSPLPRDIRSMLDQQ